MHGLSRTIFGLAVETQRRSRDADGVAQALREVVVAVLRLVRLHEPRPTEVGGVRHADPLLRHALACNETRTWVIPSAMHARVVSWRHHIARWTPNVPRMCHEAPLIASEQHHSPPALCPACRCQRWWCCRSPLPTRLSVCGLSSAECSSSNTFTAILLCHPRPADAVDAHAGDRSCHRCLFARLEMQLSRCRRCRPGLPPLLLPLLQLVEYRTSDAAQLT